MDLQEIIWESKITTMTNIITFFDGKKTYIMAFCGIATTVAYMLGFIDVNTANVLLPLFGFGSVMGLRASK